MDESESVDFTSVRFTVNVGEHMTPRNLEWLPDAATLVLQVRDEDGEVTDHRYGYTCLEHAFLLLDRLEKRESGRVLWGTGLVDLQFDGETVMLVGKPFLTGPVGEFRSATEDLITQLFEYLRRHGVDTHEVATDIADGRFAPWAADPVNVHDQLLD